VCKCRCVDVGVCVIKIVMVNIKAQENKSPIFRKYFVSLHLVRFIQNLMAKHFLNSTDFSDPTTHLTSAFKAKLQYFKFSW